MEAKVQRRNDTAATEKAMSRLLVGAIIVLVVLSALGGILTVGDHLMGASPVLGGIFYAAIAILLIVGIGYPLVQISKRPVFGLYQLEQGSERQRDRHCAMLADNMLATGQLTAEQQALVTNALVSHDSQTIASIFRTTCMPLVNDRIKAAAKRSFLASAIARGALVEALTMASISLDLVRVIVEVCGFRPTKAGLARLYTRVMASALIAGGVEDMDLEQVFSEALGSGAGAKASGLLLGGATDGLVGAYLVFRIGVITRDYLFAQTEPVREQMRRASFGEAAQLMKDSGFIAEVAQWVKAGVTDVAKSAADGVSDFAKSAADGVSDFAKATASGAAGLVRSAGAGITSAAQAAATGLAGGVRRIASGPKNR